MTMSTEIIATALHGKALLAEPYLNKGSAFPPEERDTFGLNGLLPMHASTIEEQLARTYENFRSKENPIEKVLKEKILAEQKTDKPAGGLLYYPMEKQKLKDLELRYGPQETRITVRFK